MQAKSKSGMLSPTHRHIKPTASGVHDFNHCLLGDEEGILQDDEIAIEYRAPFVLPWVVIEEAMAKQPESFVPFTAGSHGALAELLSGCCCAPIYRLVTCFPGCIAV